MKILSAFLLIFGLFSFNASAQEIADKEVYRMVYDKLQNGYIYPQPAVATAQMVLQALHHVDPKLRIADDNNRITLYYKAGVVRSYLKPQRPDDISGALNLTLRILQAAQQVSSVVKSKDFELADILLSQAINNGLDGNSKYYSAISTDNKFNFRNRRHFAARMLNNILYIHIGAFNNYTEHKLTEALQNHSQAQALILDLRGSPGGLFSQAVALADAFLDDGIIASEHGRDADHIQYYVAKSGDIAQHKPMAILVDGETMSAAEVLAVALQEQSRAKIIGTSSYGKGSKQDLISLPNGSELAYTVTHLFSPSGRSINEQGITPDICTFNMGEGRNISDIISRRSADDCPREARQKYNLDLDIAVKLLQEQI